MKAQWWSCMLGLLCMPAEVILNTWTVFQNPSSISHRSVNSSTEITCSTSLSNALGLYLLRQFHAKTVIMYMSLNEGKVTKSTVSEEFTGRIQVTPDQHITEGYGFTLRLSLLGLDDTDLYYCQWSHFKPQTEMKESLSSNGTIIIVRDYDPQEQCKDQSVDHILIFLSVTACCVILFLFIGALIWRCGRFKKRSYRPSRSVQPPRPNRAERVCPQHICPQHQHHPYMTTSAPTLDFRGIL